MAIHRTAVVDSHAEIDAAAEIGAYAIVEAGVKIAADVRLYPHAYISAGTTLQRGVEVHPFSVVGHPPQDLKYEGQPSYTVIGADTIIREQVSIHRGTLPESTTCVGQRCFLMATSHIGHNCRVGDDVIMANGSMLAGHVDIGDGAFVSGNASVHQFARVGGRVMLAGGFRYLQDVPPFMTATDAGVVGPNTVGLRRAGFTREQRQDIRELYRLIYRSGRSFRTAVADAAEQAQTDVGRTFVTFLQQESKRGYLAYRARRGRVSEAAESP